MLFNGFPGLWTSIHPDSDNGLASVWRVNSQDYYRNIGCIYDSHLYLQKENKYDIAYPILL